MRTIFYSLFILSILGINLPAQSAKKGFKSLEQQEFDKAAEVFQKIIEDNPKNTAGRFGLALVYRDDKNPAQNYLTAWKHMDAAMKNSAGLTAEETEAIAEYFTNIENPPVSWPVKKKMERENKVLEEKLIMYIREKNDLVFINSILTEFPDYKYYDNVVHIRNYLEFRKAEKAHTMDALKQFVTRYPNAAQVGRAKRIMDELAFEDARKANTIQALNDFIVKHPESLKKQDALKLRDQLAYNQAKTKNTIEGYEEFISKYPDASQLLEAKRQQMLLYYEKAKAINTYEAYTDFLRRYPEGNEYVDIFNLKALTLGKTFENACVNKPLGMDWIKAYDNQGKNDMSGGMAGAKDQSVVMAGTTLQDDEKASDAWILKLDASAKMMWNKNIGDESNDAALDIAVNKQGDILVAGYTNLTGDQALRQAWVFKLDADGKRIWNRSLGTTQANAVAVNSLDEVIVGGYKLDSLNNMKYLLYKLKADGKKLWSREYTSRGIIYDISVSTNDDINLAGGSWVFTLDKDGYIKWEVVLGDTKVAKAVTADQGGNVYLAGANGQDAWVAKFSPAGQLMWEKNFDHNSGAEEAYAISLLANKNILVGGSASNDVLLLTLDPSGNLLTKKVFGNSSNEKTLSIVATPDNKALILLNTINAGSQGDMVLIKGN